MPSDNRTRPATPEYRAGWDGIDWHPTEQEGRAGELLDFLEESERAGLVCSACRAPLRVTDSAWRFSGTEWEHQCGDPQVGYHEAKRLS